VLERTDSAGILEELAGANRFVVPLDGTGDWYRYHHLFQDLLRAELERRDASAVGRLHRQASSWFEAHGHVDEAIRHGQAAGDVERVVALIWRHALFFLATGRSATVIDLWLSPFSASEIAAEPALSVITAWCCFTDGDVDQIEAWLTFAEGATGRTLPDGSPVQSSVAVLRALGGRGGVTEMRADAAMAVELLPADSPFVALARLFEGAAARLLGEAESARTCLERAVSIGELLLPASGVHAQALLALLAIDRDEWAEASSLVTRALANVDELHLHERPGMSLIFSTAALVAAHEGSTTAARELSKRSNWLLAALKGLSPWITAEIRINLARVELFFGDVSAAQGSLARAERILADYPDAGSLATRLEAVRRQVSVTNRTLGLAAAPLTAAELRVLRYLPTHLSFAQIADELFVSRNTVKTQAIAVYRKFDVSSRAEAVARARDLGLVDASRTPSTSSS
jgi:LuxR family transcriptional regulator, maltose regulon positive regulatory protein